MTEEEWLTCDDALTMLDQLLEPTGRKRRLYCVACCRQVVTLNHEPLVREALTAAEMYADGWERRAIMVHLRGQIGSIPDFHPWLDNPSERVCIANAVAASCAPGVSLQPRIVLDWVAEIFRQQPSGGLRAVSAHAKLLRDILGNPFRPVAFNSAWRTDTAVSLASQMYESRDFGAILILADALQDAGCDSKDVLSHCRDTNATHVRGCWVIDLVLGKQ